VSSAPSSTRHPNSKEGPFSQDISPTTTAWLAGARRPSLRISGCAQPAMIEWERYTIIANMRD
jgi:hypothetical protein